MRALARAPLLLVVAYLVTIAAGLAHHPMWLDEAQAWCVSRDAHSLRELFWNMRYDGHPSLWYLCLYLVTRFTDNPVAMQILHGTIAVATVALIAWRSPFARWERWLLAFGYLFAFEFAVISRGYAIGVLLVLAVCHWSSCVEERIWPIALALVGLANTSVYGTILAICLLAALSYDVLVRGRRRQVTFAAAAAIVIAGCAAAVATMKPPPDFAFAREWHTRITTQRAADTANLVWAGMAPLPDFSAAAPWNTSMLPTHRGRPTASTLLAAAAVVMILVIGWTVRKAPIAMNFYLSGTAALLLFMYLKYSAGPRHCGHLFLVFIAALWLARSETSNRLARFLDVVFWSAGAAQVAVAVFFLAKSWYVPFSWSRDLEAAVRELAPQGAVVVGDVTLVNYVGPVLSAYLRHQIDYAGPNSIRRGSFMILDEAHHPEAPPNRVRATLQRDVAPMGARYVLLVTSQWRYATDMGPSIGEFRRHLVGVEGVATIRAVRLDDNLRESRRDEIPPRSVLPELQLATYLKPAMPRVAHPESSGTIRRLTLGRARS
jgi:hypothetical protein